MKAFLLLIVIFCLLAYASAKVIGVSPQDQEKYIRGKNKYFQCFDKSATISIDKINDDFCDCKDGSDEPGTSACSFIKQTQFFCENKGYLAKNIFTSNVNDGVCDCCDGSDEYNGQTTCANTCHALGGTIRAEYAQKLDVIKRALQQKQQQILFGQIEITRINNEVSEKRQKLDSWKEEMQKLEQAKDLAEKQEEIERNLLRESEAAEKAKKAAEEAAQKPAEPTAAAAAPEATATDATAEKPAEPAQELPITAAPVAEPEPASASYKNEEAEKARKQFQEKKADVDNLQREVDELQSTLAYDYGKDKQYYALRGKCFSIDSKEYTYEMCPYGKSSQKDKRGYGDVNLGTFSKWDGENNTLMKFENGQTCWNGPARSNLVSFICGAENKVVKVDEPSRCVYAMNFETPEACTTADEEEWTAKLKQLE